MEIIEKLLTNYTFLTIALIAATIYAAAASISVKTTFAKFNNINVNSRIPACEAARQILDLNGLYDVQVVRIGGNLTDHYDPRKKVVALSDSVYGSAAIGAIGVAAHECGHAVQHARGYFPIRVRTALVPVVNVCSQAWVWVFMLGCFIGSLFVAELGIAFFGATAIFQLVTLPVEFNASRRAIKVIEETSLLYEDEINGAKKVLSAAAMTYVASMLVALANLLRLILRFNRRRN